MYEAFYALLLFVSPQTEALQHPNTQQVVTKCAHNHAPTLEKLHHFLRALDTLSLPKTERVRIEQAICFAAEKHQFQTRKDLAETPYLIHPLSVAEQIISLGKVTDPEILIAALLHDTVEDTQTSFDEIKIAFGPIVEGYVREVTDDKSLPKAERKRLQIVHAPHKSMGAAIIKLSDKLDNLRSMTLSAPIGWTQERRDAYFVWANEVVNALPPANPSLKEAVLATIAAYQSR